MAILCTKLAGHFTNYIKCKMESESACPTSNKNFEIDNIKFFPNQKEILDLLKVSCKIWCKNFCTNSDNEL